MKRAIVAAMLVLLSEAGPSQTTLSSVPQWYKPCSNAEGDTQSQWFVKTLEEVTAYPLR